MKRKIAAIMAADVVGFSRLVRENEEETLERLLAYRSIFDEYVRAANGRIFNTAGDAVLAETPSAVDALRAAMDIQEAVRTRNLGLPAEKQLVFRIGLTVGDVVEHGADLLGDGVNVAARLQTLAAPGGICISQSLHDQVTHKVSVALEDLGPKTVKNIAQPIRVYRVAPATAVGGEPAPAGRRRGRVLAGAGVALVLAAVAAVGAMKALAPAAPEPRVASAPAAAETARAETPPLQVAAAPPVALPPALPQAPPKADTVAPPQVAAVEAAPAAPPPPAQVLESPPDLPLAVALARPDSPPPEPPKPEPVKPEPLTSAPPAAPPAVDPALVAARAQFVRLGCAVRDAPDWEALRRTPEVARLARQASLDLAAPSAVLLERLKGLNGAHCRLADATASVADPSPRPVIRRAPAPHPPRAAGRTKPLLLRRRADLLRVTLMTFPIRAGLLASALALVPAAALGQSASAHGCSHASFSFCPDCDVVIEVRAKPGGFCTFPYFSTGGVVSQRVVLRPRQGVYGTSNPTSGGFKASPGAKGTDDFQVDVAYRRGGGVVTTHIKARVIYGQ